MVEFGFTPRAVHLVPRNELDERYAYFVLDRPSDGGGRGSDVSVRVPARLVDGAGAV